MIAAPGQRRARRDRAPARRLRGVEPVWSSGRWRWRARLVEDGKARVGPLRDTQEHAGKDRTVLEQRRSGFRTAQGLTVAAALGLVTEAARRRNVSERTLRAMFASHSRFIVRQLSDELLLVDLDADRLRRFVLEAIRAGRSANTIWGKDCWLLGRAFRIAGLPDVVPEVRREMRGTTKRVPAEVVFFDPRELTELIARMRAGRVMDGMKAPKPEVCEADADLVELLALSGVRAGELGRVRVADVHIEHCRVRVAEAKDRAHPRYLDLPGTARPLLTRMIARAKATAGTSRASEVLLFEDSEARLSRIAQRWKRLLDERRLSGRVLRHSFGTALLTVAGASPTEAMHALGHRRIGTTGRYIAAVSQRGRDLAERLGSVLRPSPAAPIPDLPPTEASA